MNHDDVVVGQFDPRVVLYQLGVIPLGNAAKKDARQSGWCEVQFDSDSRDIVGWHVGAKHRRKVKRAAAPLFSEVRELRIGHRAIAGAEIDSTFCGLLYSAPGANRLIVELDIWMHLVVLVEPLGIHWVRERGPRSVHQGLGRARGAPKRHCGAGKQADSFHLVSFCYEAVSSPSA